MLLKHPEDPIGASYLLKVTKHARGITRQHLCMRGIGLLQAITIIDEVPTIPDLLYEAHASGLITYEQLEDVDDADLILFGKTIEGPDSYVLAEVSLTINDHDIGQAHRRAAVLTADSGVQTKAAVIGAQISDANWDLAKNSNVAVIIEPDEERG